MKVKCVRNKLAELCDPNIKNWITNYLHRDEDEALYIVKGQEYVVYGIVFWDNHPFYMLCEEENDEYPTPFYAGFFEVTDNRLPSGWKLHYDIGEYGKASSSLLYKTWATENDFYERLLDGDETIVALFHSYRKEMDQEAALPQ